MVLPSMAGAGLLQFVMLVTNMLAFSITQVAYAVSVKRTSLLIGVVLGFVFFKEGRWAQRGAGAVLMFAGFVVVALGG